MMIMMMPLVVLAHLVALVLLTALVLLAVGLVMLMALVHVDLGKAPSRLTTWRWRCARTGDLMRDEW